MEERCQDNIQDFLELILHKGDHTFQIEAIIIQLHHPHFIILLDYLLHQISFQFI
jgi:hypothetical protein